MAAELVRPDAPAPRMPSARTPSPTAPATRTPSTTAPLTTAPLTTAGARVWLAATVTGTIAAAAAAVALAPPAGARAPEALAFLLFVGSSVHVASTGWFYTVPEVRAHMRQRPARYLWWPLALMSGAGAIAFLLPRPALYWLLLPYFGWQFFHYQKQNLGITALTASSLRVLPLRTSERRALTAAGLAGIGALLARPGLLQLPLPSAVPVLFPLAAVAFAASVAAGTGCLLRRGPDQRPAGFCVAYLTSLAFSVPVFAFSSPYAAVAGLTIAHGLQYLVLMGLLAAGGPRRTQRAARLTALAALANIALVGGAALSVASDQLSTGPAMRILYGFFLGTVMAHFVIDAGLWRMRAAFPREFLRSRLPYLVPTSGGGLRGPSADPSASDIRCKGAEDARGQLAQQQRPA